MMRRWSNYCERTYAQGGSTSERAVWRTLETERQSLSPRLFRLLDDLGYTLEPGRKLLDRRRQLVRMEMCRAAERCPDLARAPGERFTRAGPRGTSTSRSIALLTCESRSISREMICAPAWARPCSGRALSARVTTRAKWRDSRSAASASARARNSGVPAATTRSASRLSSAPVSSASYNPGWSGWSATAEECASDCARRRERTNGPTEPARRQPVSRSVSASVGHMRRPSTGAVEAVG